MKKIFLLPLNLKNKTIFLLEKLKNENFPFDFIYITSNYCKIKDFKFKFYKYFQSFFGPQAFTLKNLAIKIIEEKSPKRIISEIEKYLLILQFIKKNKISYNEEGKAQIISNFIKELKKSSISIDEIPNIERKIENYPWKYDKIKENIKFALLIFKEYENYLSNNNLIDQEDIYKEASSFIEKGEFKNLVFENILEIPKYQRKFISKLITFCENVFFFYFDPSFFSIDTQELIIKDTFNFLSEIEDWEKVQVKGEVLEPVIECYNFATKEEEVNGILELIYEEKNKKNSLTLDDFIITCPDILSYRNQIKRTFSRFNIPVEIIPGYSLIKNPSISSLFEFLIFSETYSWENLMNILMSPYFKEFNKEEIKKISEETRKKYEKTGFYKDNFEKLNYHSLKVIKKCLNLMKRDKMSLNKWKEVILNIIKNTKWEPSEVEVKIEFEKVIDKLSGSYYITKESFINLMNKLLEMVEVEEGKGTGIRVSGVIESLGIEKEICIFCGATEKNFPNTPKVEEFFLPDTLKKDLNLEYFEKRVARDRGDFYRIKNEHEKIIFTYPSKVGDELQMRSILIFDLPVKQKEKQAFFISSKELFKVETSLEKFKEKYVKNGIFTIDVTDLEKLLKCPYKFYLEKIENIKPYEIPSIKEDPKLWGTLIHESFRKTFEEEKNKTIEIKKIKEYKEKFEYWINKMINEKIENNEISKIYGQILRLRYPIVLEKFEQIIFKHAENIFIDFEKKIDTKNEKFKIIGKVDIIEKNIKDGKLAIIDIKTGTSSKLYYTEKDFFENHNIQVPLYIWIYARENALPYEEIIGIIWNFSFFEDDKDIEKKFNFSQDKSKRNYLDKIEEYLNEKIEEIMNGKFSFMPEPNRCEYICEYKELCIYGE